MRFFLGVLSGIVLCALLGLAYMKFGHLPVAVSDAAFPFERAITHTALDARIDRDTRGLQPAVAAGPETFAAGVPLYVQKCSYCHGLPGKPSTMKDAEYPSAPQLFNKHRNGVVGVSDDEPSETYWKIKNGIRLSGMPSYQKELSDTQMWQLAQTLANADKLPSDTQQQLAGASIPQ